MTKNILLTTAYFPPVNYFSAIKRAETITLEQFENFGKQSFRNRCEIMTANGIIPLTVPVAKANSKTLIKDLRIVYVTPWQKLHFRGIESAYKNSPFYDYYIDDLQPFFEEKETFLWDLNHKILECTCQLLKMDYTPHFTDDYVHEAPAGITDLRNAFHPKALHRQAVATFPDTPYRQTFSDRFPFTPNLSILDLLFCCGPEAAEKL